jgi:hypothetical protein
MVEMAAKSKIGCALADSLCMFSMDLVGLCTEYAFPIEPMSNTQPSFMFAFGKESVYSLAVSPDSLIWCGSNSGCDIFSLDGQFVRHAAHDQFTRRCFGIAFDSNGEVFCSERERHRILVCSLDGGFIRSFGSEGSGTGYFYYPEALAVDGRGWLFVADSSNHRIQIVTRDGHFVNTFGSKGLGDGQFSYPGGIAFSSCGELFVADCVNARVQVRCF